MSPQQSCESSLPSPAKRKKLQGIGPRAGGKEAGLVSCTAGEAPGQNLGLARSQYL